MLGWEAEGIALLWVKHNHQRKTAAREAKILLAIFFLLNHQALKFEEENRGRVFLNASGFARSV